MIVKIFIWAKLLVKLTDRIRFEPPRLFENNHVWPDDIVLDNPLTVRVLLLRYRFVNAMLSLALHLLVWPMNAN